LLSQGSVAARALAGLRRQVGESPQPRGVVARRAVRSIGWTLLASLLAAPLAIAWGVAHAEVRDYLGPNVVEFSANYGHEVSIDLGPLGRAFLPSPAAPVGVQITVGGLTAGSVSGSLLSESLLSEQTLTAYTSLFADPEEAIAGIVDRLVADMVVESLQAEVVLLIVFAVWLLRRRLLSPAIVPHVSLRRTLAVYVAVMALVLGSIVAPPPPTKEVRLPVTVDEGTAFEGLTVDSFVLADVLDRGVKGVRLLSARQRRAVDRYVESASQNLLLQFADLPAPAEGETMLLGFSDLHCNLAMTQLLSALAAATEPDRILSSGDDTVNGTAAERGCITREAEIGGDTPFLVSTGNHDSDITEGQMSNAGMVVLNGQVVDSDGLSVLGDDDPERQVPFSVDRVRDRPETEEQLAQRLLDVARRDPVDVLLVHQPAASAVVMNEPDPPARLVLWGHYHDEHGPVVVRHRDGSWTVGMQQGTAGGVKQPTITSFSTPFSAPLVRADVYFYFRDSATGLITGVQPVHFSPDATVEIGKRISTGDPDRLPLATRESLGAVTPSPSAPDVPRR
jgi:hypothetical protein